MPGTKSLITLAFALSQLSLHCSAGPLSDVLGAIPTNRLFGRQDGIDCNDPACTPVANGCGCSYADDSWVTETNGANSTTGGTTTGGTTGGTTGETSPATTPPSGITPTPTTAPSPSSTAEPYCIPYQNPEEGESNCQCTDGSTYSMTSGGNPCPYTSPGPTSMLITPSSSPSPTSTGTLSTETDPMGNVIACTSFSALTIGVPGSVCEGPTISTASTSTPTAGLPSSCSSAAPRITANGAAPDQSCAGSDGDAHSDIFTCNGNQTLFDLFAPGGTPHSHGQAKNDEGGWASFSGEGCFCINGNFCCDEGASTCLPLDASFWDSINYGPGANEVEWYQQVRDQCNCQG